MNSDLTVLILGVTGLLGTALEENCKSKNLNYLGLSHRDFEITDKEELMRILDSEHPNVIINTVAMVGIDSCENSPVQAYKVNTLAPYWLAKYADRRNITLVQISSVEVFDGLKKQPYVESDLPNSKNIYGLTKQMAESLVENYCRRYFIVRLPGMFGKRRNKKFGYADKVYEWINSKEPLRVADDKIDSPSYSLDVAENILDLIINKRPYDIYHIANEGETSLYDFVIEMANIYNKNINISRAKVSDFPTKAHKSSYAVLTSEKLPALRNWKEALREFINIHE